MKTLSLAIASIVVSVAAQFFLKAGVSGLGARDAATTVSSIAKALLPLKEPLVVAGLVLYGFGAVLWLAVLSEWDVSKAYPLVGLGFALAVLIGFIFGEGVTVQRIVGVALICAGVLVVGRT